MSAREPLSTQQAFYGLNFRDAEIAALTRKVMMLASLAAAIACVNNLWGLAAAFVMGPMIVVAIVNLCLALVLPFCGYQGAKSNDKNLIGCFCGCNFVSGLLGCWHLFGFISDHLWVNALIQIPFSALACASFYYGKGLYDHLDKGLVITMPPAYPATNPQMVQPGAYAGGAADV